MTFTKNDQFCDPPCPVPHPPHPQKGTIDMETCDRFQNSPTLFRVDVINAWPFAPQTFESNYLTYLSVALRFREGKIKKFQHLKISSDSANLFCSVNPRNQRKIAKNLYY